MSTQSEKELEDSLIAVLVEQGYERVFLNNEDQLLNNLRTKLASINDVNHFTDEEWQQVINYLDDQGIFANAKKIRNFCPIEFNTGEFKHIKFIHEDHRKNVFQVANQIRIGGEDEGALGRFDVTILINGLPLVQIELKKSDVEIETAFNQIKRYKESVYSLGKGLFNYIQLFVISNGVNSRYFANGTKSISFAFKWADVDNKVISALDKWVSADDENLNKSKKDSAFFDTKHITDMILKYTVLLEEKQVMKVLRPYQVYAVKEIMRKVKDPDSGNGYIWHTTGSGKTLTSFKASQMMSVFEGAEKVLFVVDRCDLDSQTVSEFNAFEKDCVNSTDNTGVLIKQLKDPSKKLIVTTLQKLNNAITKNNAEKLKHLQDERVIFIFDECHRSQFGKTHTQIKSFFKNSQMFGFTGTPILEENGKSFAQASTYKEGKEFKLTTAHLFGENLHTYTIIDAIRDKNVLGFQVDYYGYFKEHGDGVVEDKRTPEEVEAIDTQELFENPERLTKIANHILDIHSIKTKNRAFNAIFCVSSVEVLTKYYEIFERLQAERKKQDPNYKPLKIAAIFSYGVNNSDDGEQNGLLSEEFADTPKTFNQTNKAKLDDCIAKYNQEFDCSYNSGNGFYDYYRDISSRIKKNEIDILLVVNMFLTGFDSKRLNTLYVDKNLKQHGLIQAYSRTNRVLDASKPFGNVVCYRNLKDATDEALELFSNGGDFSGVRIRPMEEILKDYDAAVELLLALTPTYEAVDELRDEREQVAFIRAFRNVIRLDAQLKTFVGYNQDDTRLNKQQFANYTGKYKDLYNSIKTVGTRSKTSVLNCVDFQLELIHSDRVNVGYVLDLIAQVAKSGDEQKIARARDKIKDLLDESVSLYDKKDLIEKFLEQQVPKLINGQSITEYFKEFWEVEKEREFQQLCDSEQIKPDELKVVMDECSYLEREPLYEEMSSLPVAKPNILKRKERFGNLLKKTSAFFNRFYQGL